MINKVQLQQMRSVDITQVDRSTLVDIRNIHIDSSLPAAKKMQNYFEQIVNPCLLYTSFNRVRLCNRHISSTAFLMSSISCL